MQFPKLKKLVVSWKFPKLQSSQIHSHIAKFRIHEFVRELRSSQTRLQMNFTNLLGDWKVHKCVRRLWSSIHSQVAKFINLLLWSSHIRSQIVKFTRSFKNEVDKLVRKLQTSQNRSQIPKFTNLLPNCEFTNLFANCKVWKSVRQLRS